MDATAIIFILPLLFLSIIAHEVAHGYVAEMLGDETARYAGRLTLNPLPHIDPVGSIFIPFLGYISGGFIFGWAKPVPYNPENLRGGRLGEALVAFAGPATNILLAIILGLMLRLGSDFFPESFASIGFAVVFLNLSLAIFNLIPIPPSDGSKILFSILSFRLQYIERHLEPYGLFLLLIFAFFLWKTFYPFIVFLSAFLTGQL
ncbi:MAG: site-2 protease family protein [Patescibacteria group bacterium]